MLTFRLSHPPLYFFLLSAALAAAVLATLGSNRTAVPGEEGEEEKLKSTEGHLEASVVNAPARR